MDEHVARPAMLEQIDSVPDLMETMWEDVLYTAQSTAASLPVSRLQHIILTGCGDSLAAAYATRQAFMQLCNLPVSVEPAMELSRFYSAPLLAAQNMLVVIISNSGNVSRAVELARRIQKVGGLALALTGNAASPLCAQTPLHLLLSIPGFPHRGPGLRSYCACLLGLYALAIQLGKARGANNTLCKAAQTEIQGLAKQIHPMLPGWNSQALQAAKSLAACTSYEFVGAGPEYGTALFAYAKELESAAKPATVQNTEDWMHMNFFVRNVSATGTFLLGANSSPAAGRTAEVLHTMSGMGRPVVYITSEQTPPLNKATVIQTPALTTPWLNPLVQYLPLSMVQAHLGVLFKEVDFRGTQDNWSACIGFATVAASQQEIWD